MVVLLVPPPVHLQGGVEELAQIAGVQLLPEKLDGLIEAVLLIDAGDDAHFVPSGDDAPGVRHGQRQRFLDDDVAAVPDAVDGDLGVIAAFGGNGHQFRGLLVQHFMVVSVDRNVGQVVALQ